jgi:4-carboxymuconolactone decarboxylase
MTTSTTAKPTGKSLLAQGTHTFPETFGIPADAFIADVNASAPGFGTLIVEMEFGDIYNRPGLDLRTRELCIIGSCGTLGATGAGAVRMHIPAALRAGATRAEIVEVLVQVAMAAGLPTALNALQVARETFVAIDAAESAPAVAA